MDSVNTGDIHGNVAVGTTRSVTIAVCTLRRPQQLEQLLASLTSSLDLPATAELSEVLVVDNDGDGSARQVAAAFSEEAGGLVRYVHEPLEGYARARNRALQECRTDVLIFIDDDETPDVDWPGGLLAEMGRSGAAIVGGPVVSRLPSAAPSWIVEGDYFGREIADHGSVPTWLRSGNLALDVRRIRAAGLEFHDAFNRSGGEDVAFTRAAAAAGLPLSWSEHGTVVEDIPVERCTESWLIGRERASASSYARARLLVEGRRRAAPELILRACSTIPRAVLQVGQSVARRRPKPLLGGRLLLARGRGQIDGVRRGLTS